jgi:hypothetical protein
MQLIEGTGVSGEGTSGVKILLPYTDMQEKTNDPVLLLRVSGQELRRERHCIRLPLF